MSLVSNCLWFVLDRGRLRGAACVFGVFLSGAVVPVGAFAQSGRVNGKIAYVAQSPANRSVDDIFTINSDGTDRRNLTGETVGSNTTPVWSPDGTKIAFTTNRNGNYEVYVMNADGSGVKNLTRNPADDSSPTWSSDGSRIAFLTERHVSNSEIYTMNIDGSGQKNLTNTPMADERRPVWSPDGTKIAFARNYDLKMRPVDKLYVIDPEGSNEKLLYDPMAGKSVYSVSWSPDSAKILFNNDELFYTVTLDQTLESFPLSGRFTDAMWSPNDGRLTFTGQRGAIKNDLYVAAPDASGFVNITNTPDLHERNPAWQSVPAPPRQPDPLSPSEPSPGPQQPPLSPQFGSRRVKPVGFVVKGKQMFVKFDCAVVAPEPVSACAGRVSIQGSVARSGKKKAQVVKSLLTSTGFSVKANSVQALRFKVNQRALTVLLRQAKRVKGRIQVRVSLQSDQSRTKVESFTVSLPSKR